MPNTAPTKGNLMSAKRSRTLAETGWELMDKKRNILIRELLARVDEATALQTRVDDAFREAYAALREAELANGSCGGLATGVPTDDSIRLRWKSVMGAELPIVTAEAASTDRLPYSLADSSAALDEAYRCFAGLRSLLAQLAETETAVYRLAYSIRKAQKRANALQNIVIPGLDTDIARIADALEEKEREEFVRMKVVKARNKA